MWFVPLRPSHPVPNPLLWTERLPAVTADLYLTMILETAVASVGRVRLGRNFNAHAAETAARINNRFHLCANLHRFNPILRWKYTHRSGTCHVAQSAFWRRLVDCSNIVPHRVRVT